MRLAALIFTISTLMMVGQAVANSSPQPTRTEIKSLQNKLVSLASQQRKGEQKLAELSIKQARLDARITDARTKIEESQEEIDALLQSLVRLSRTPPEAVVAMPGELRKTLQAAQLMSSLTEQMQEKTSALSSLLARLQKDELELAETREKVKQQQAKMIASRKALEQKLSKRKADYEKNNTAFKRKKQQALQAKKKAKDVKQLVKKLEKKKAKPKPKTVVQSLPFSKRRGKLRLPVAGRVSKRYGQKIGEDQTSRGYQLASASGATVTSPASGEVMFTGPFLDYGKIVILRYDSGYHLLLAGFDRINCSVGQKLVAGEPIGRLKANSNSRADLYMELRKNGKPIDPSPWFG